MTNGDYIRTLITNNAIAAYPRLLCELANSLSIINPGRAWGCAGCPFDKDNLCENGSSEALMEWLKAERKEEVKSND